MACFAPRTAYYPKSVEASKIGLDSAPNKSLVFDKRKSHSGIALQVPCGTCIGCKKSYARQWQARLMHEKKMSTISTFITITYSDQYLPKNNSLNPTDLQLFLKRLRKKQTGIRFYACGEYGETTHRPHYHAIIFNYSFSDQKKIKDTPAGHPLYRSDELSNLWPFGDNYIGDVTAESCAYVAGYVVKKLKKETLNELHPEFVRMSLKPGIGKTFYEKFGQEIYKHDSVIINGKEAQVPRYYDTLHAKQEAERLEKIKIARRRKAKLIPKIENTLRRRAAREKFEHAKAAIFKREAS